MKPLGAVLVVLVIVGALLAIGCTSTPSSTNIPRSTTMSQTQAPEPVAYQFSGSGQSATELFSLHAGLARFEISGSGDGLLIVWLLDDQGKKLELLASDATPPFQASKAVNVKGGKYLLDISTDEDWQVSVRQ